MYRLFGTVLLFPNIAALVSAAFFPFCLLRSNVPRSGGFTGDLLPVQALVRLPVTC
jgi:hypothetical protein